MKVLALYLPQYHEIPENNQWWGEGYTEWTAVKQAVPYKRGQIQPRVPLNDNYYDLSDETAATWKWQADLAKKYNIYGFVIYHYWFDSNNQLLEKPMEILQRHPEIDIRYSICWANESWTRTWYGIQSETLKLQEYGDEAEWIKHFEYLLQFFKDPRYITINNKPMINIYHSAEIERLSEMINVWNGLAIKNGFDGVFVVSGNTGAALEQRTDLVDAYYNFEPSYTLSHKQKKIERFVYLCRVLARSTVNTVFKTTIIERPINGRRFVVKMNRNDYASSKPIYPCVFPKWDNTPRRKYKGTVFEHTTVDTFRRQIQDAKAKYTNAAFIYVNAWNEWGEGANLEPDTVDRYAYLEVIQNEFKDQS